LCEKYLEEALDADADTAWQKLGPGLMRHVPPPKRKVPGLRIVTACATCLLIAVFAVSMALWLPGGTPSGGGAPPIGQNPSDDGPPSDDVKRPGYRLDDLTPIQIDHLGELDGVYSRNLEISGFHFDKGLLYQSVEDPVVNVYMQLDYNRHIDGGDTSQSLYENDVIRIVILLVENVEYPDDVGYEDKKLSGKMDYVIDKQPLEINYCQETGDVDGGGAVRASVWTKFKVGKTTYCISATYTALTDTADENLLAAILDQLF